MQEINKNVGKRLPLMAILADQNVLRPDGSPSLCVGCPNRPFCEKGFINGFFVLQCKEPIDPATAIETIARRSGVPKEAFQ